MPYKNSTLKLLIPRELNGTVKLSLEDKDIIRNLKGIETRKALALKYNVSESLIKLIWNPHLYEKCLLRRRNKKYKYSREIGNQYKQRNRHKRQELYLNGKLVNNNDLFFRQIGTSEIIRQKIENIITGKEHKKVKQ